MLNISERTSIRKVFNLLPDFIVLDLATRKFNMVSPKTCICGWALRNGLIALADKIAEEGIELNWTFGTPEKCAMLYGGTSQNWDVLFGTVTEPENIPAIETLFITRLEKALANA